MLKILEPTQPQPQVVFKVFMCSKCSSLLLKVRSFVSFHQFTGYLEINLLNLNKVSNQQEFHHLMNYQNINLNVKVNTFFSDSGGVKSFSQTECEGLCEAKWLRA